MTSIKFMRPDPEDYHPLPQCEHSVIITRHEAVTGWRRKRYGERGTVVNKCQRSASVEIDGKHYCRPHAGQIALKILAGQSGQTEGE